ncbi:MAG: aminoglycoside phosphotransferase family protein [Actinomycetota bacterium]|nr:aminoglycoside phosphotransferase family protein [Actinomycetota bacterium]
MDSVTDRDMEPYGQSTLVGALHSDQRELLDGLISHLQLRPGSVGIAAISRGRSIAQKVVIKPSGLFPLLVKLDTSDRIQTELHGDRIIRLRVPSVSIPDPVWHETRGATGILAYRYVTHGRLVERAQRLDVWASTVPKHQLLRLLDRLYESVLKKMHWQDGRTTAQEITPPGIDQPIHGSLQRSIKMAYDAHVQRTVGGSVLRCPVGIVHGDLHAKNVLVDSGGAPILIDFDRVSYGQPIVLDYVKMDVFLPLSACTSLPADPTRGPDLEYSIEVHQRVASRLYRAGELIVPRSMRPLASAVHEVRSVFWRGCVSRTGGMDPGDVDDVYGVFLAHALARYLIRRLDEEGNANAEPGFHTALLAFNSLVSDGQQFVEPIAPEPDAR